MGDYRRACSDVSFPRWDAVVLTASNETQAAGYRMQLAHRKDALPAGTDYLVVPDKEDKRVGSAGSTLSVIRQLKGKYGDFSNKKVLVIHAGGNSSRCPQYSAVGKLFAPFLAEVNGRPATLFDMFMLTMAGIPGRLKNGMLLLSGDVTLLFNPLMCDFGDAPAAVISFMENVETGKDHGVYVRNAATGNVKSFLHKKPAEELRVRGAVDGQGRCAIDTGAIWLSPVILDRLYALVDTDEKYGAMVNDRARLSLYSDIAYCLSEDATIDLFQQETPEGDYCPELTAARHALWNAIGQYTMKLISLSPAKFLHFGSIPEILAFVNVGVDQYAALGWGRQTHASVAEKTSAAYNAVAAADAVLGDGCYLENSEIMPRAVIGAGTYVSGLRIPGGVTVPDHVLLHGLKLSDGKFVCRIMDVSDNPKKNLLFGKDLSVLGIRADSLWNADVYPVCDTMEAAILSAVNLYRMVATNDGDFDAWKNADKTSLCSGFNNADSSAIIRWNSRVSELVEMNSLEQAIRSGIPVQALKKPGTGTKLTNNQRKWLSEKISSLDMTAPEDFSFALRLNEYAGVLYQDDTCYAAMFKQIADTVIRNSDVMNNVKEDLHIVTDRVSVAMPLRVNWGGGWTDASPYCIEHGGAVLNAAITVNGTMPVEVEILKTPEERVSFYAWDMDARGSFDTIEPLQETNNPFDAFALQKACLIACGIIPRSGGDLKTLLHALGGGFEIRTGVRNIPKGSGLGTSSILSAATAKAVYTFFGKPFTDKTLYETVFVAEQIMSTGGGWQDQVGGVTPGIKLVTSHAGFHQELTVESVAVSDKTLRELNERFAIIYTGQRRLARNLLRDVVGKYVGNDPDSVFAHHEIKRVAYRMRDALLQDDVDEFARLLNYHWELLMKIDGGITNSLIEQIFASIDDLIDARMRCGAGGGGFLQVLLKHGVSHDDVHARLKAVFGDFPVDVWKCSID